MPGHLILPWKLVRPTLNIVVGLVLVEWGDEGDLNKLEETILHFPL